MQQWGASSCIARRLQGHGVAVDQPGGLGQVSARREGGQKLAQVSGPASWRLIGAAGRATLPATSCGCSSTGRAACARRRRRRRTPHQARSMSRPARASSGGGLPRGPPAPARRPPRGARRRWSPARGQAAAIDPGRRSPPQAGPPPGSGERRRAPRSSPARSLRAGHGTGWSGMSASSAVQGAGAAGRRRRSATSARVRRRATAGRHRRPPPALPRFGGSSRGTGRAPASAPGSVGPAAAGQDVDLLEQEPGGGDLVGSPSAGPIPRPRRRSARAWPRSRAALAAAGAAGAADPASSPRQLLQLLGRAAGLRRRPAGGRRWRVRPPPARLAVVGSQAAARSAARANVGGQAGDLLAPAAALEPLAGVRASGRGPTSSAPPRPGAPARRPAAGQEAVWNRPLLQKAAFRSRLPPGPRPQQRHRLPGGVSRGHRMQAPRLVWARRGGASAGAQRQASPISSATASAVGVSSLATAPIVARRRRERRSG
jgi:hypothetical protein